MAHAAFEKDAGIRNGPTDPLAELHLALLCSQLQSYLSPDEQSMYMPRYTQTRLRDSFTSLATLMERVELRLYTDQRQAGAAVLQGTKEVIAPGPRRPAQQKTRLHDQPHRV